MESESNLAFSPEELDEQLEEADEDFEIGEDDDVSDDLDIDTHLETAYDALTDEGAEGEDESQEQPLKSEKAARLTEEQITLAKERGLDLEAIEAISQITDPVELAAAIEEAERGLIREYEGKHHELSQRVQSFEPLQRVHDYWGQYLGSLGIDMATATNALISYDHALRTGTPEQKRQMIDYLKQSYGVVDSGEESYDAYVDPQVKALEVRQQQTEQQIHQFFQYQQRQQEAYELQAAGDEIDAFRNETDGSGRPLRPHFDQVQDQMTKFINSGTVNSLQEAYDAAVAADPEVRMEILREEREMHEHMRLMRAAKAKKARRANVRPKSSGPMIAQHDSWDDELSALYDKLNP